MLDVINISKQFGDFKAVEDVSFKAKQGEVLGFLGPNGAGKSTSMKMITGFLDPSSGDVFINGNSIKEERLQAQSHIGYVPENAPLYDEMYVKEFLIFMAGMRQLAAEEIPQVVERVLKLCSIKNVEYQRIETLSKGYKRRVSLAQALLHDPKVLILDEPTDGLDPNQKHDVRKLIKELAKEKCILISTHILEEVEEICDRCIIIGDGKMLFEGTHAELKSKSNLGRIQDVFRSITLGVKCEGVSV